MAEWVKAAGVLVFGVLGGSGMLLMGMNVDKFAEQGLKSHMSAQDAGKQLGEKAFEAFAQMQHDHRLHFGNPQRSWLEWISGK